MTSRFPPMVSQALHAAGWHPGRNELSRARDWTLHLAAFPASDGRVHPVVPGAIEVLAEFGGLRIDPAGEGEQVAPSSVHLDPMLAAHSWQTLAGLAEAIGSPLTPIGVENEGTGLLAIDATGRVFVCDHTAEWYLGASIEAALTTLLTGRRPARVRPDGSW